MSSLGSFLKDQGFKVNDNPVLSRDATWDKVRWLFVHHTADTCDPKQAGSRASYIKTASGRYPPLAQLMLGRDQVIYVCAKQRDGDAEPGRASHAGEGSYPGISTDQGNEVSLGVEVQCSGAHPISHHADSYKTLIRLLAALCQRYGLDESKVIGHKEYSSTGKIDPRDSMATIRADVQDALEQEEEGPMKYWNLTRDAEQDLEGGQWSRVAWDNEAADEGKWHKDGNTGIYVTEGLISCGVYLRTREACYLDLRIMRAESGTPTGAGTIMAEGYGFAGKGTLMAPAFGGSAQGLFVEVKPETDTAITYAQFRGSVGPR